MQSVQVVPAFDEVEDRGAGFLEKDGTVWRPAHREKHDFNVPRGRTGPKVTSTQIDPGSTDLSRATEIPRFAKQDYGGINFAAGRYIEPESGNEIILVGDSEGPHSERTIGYPLLKHGKEANLSEVYTERKPCQLSPSATNGWTFTSNRRTPTSK